MVAAWGFTAVSSGRGFVVWDWERAFLDLCVLGGGKRASQMRVYGGWGSAVGTVKRGVSQRENGDGGS